MSIWTDVTHWWDRAWKSAESIPAAWRNAVHDISTFAGQVMRATDWIVRNPLYAGYLALSALFDAIDGNFAAAQRAIDRMYHDSLGPAIKVTYRQAHYWYQGNRAFIVRVWNTLHAYMVNTNQQIYHTLPAQIEGTWARARDYTKAIANQIATARAHDAYKAAIAEVNNEATSGYRQGADKRLTQVKDLAETAKWIGKFLAADDPLAGAFADMAGYLGTVIGLIEGHTGPHGVTPVIGQAFADIGQLQALAAGQAAREKASITDGVGLTALMLAWTAAAIDRPAEMAQVTVDALSPVAAALNTAITPLVEGGQTVADLPFMFGDTVTQALTSLAAHIAPEAETLMAKFGL